MKKNQLCFYYAVLGNQTFDERIYIQPVHKLCSFKSHHFETVYTSTEFCVNYVGLFIYLQK